MQCDLFIYFLNVYIFILLIVMYLKEFATDIAVCMDSWVGGIRMTHFKVWLATPDGSRCVINEMDSRALGQLEEKRDNVRTLNISHNYVLKFIKNIFNFRIMIFLILLNFILVRIYGVLLTA